MNFRTTCAVASIMLIVAACSKQALTKAADGNEATGLIGTWQWVRTDGGIAYNIHQTPASTGQQIDLKLADGTYAFYTNNALTAQGTYSIETRTCIHDHTQKPFLHFSASPGFMIEASPSDSLFVSDENYDGLGSSYTRKITGIK